MDASTEVRGLRKRYGETLVLDGSSFETGPGQVTGFLGPHRPLLPVRPPEGVAGRSRRRRLHRLVGRIHRQELLGRALAASLAALIVATTLIASPAEARPGSVTSDDLAQELDWQPCHPERTAETGTVFECAELLVPLDYDQVRGGRIADGGAEQGNDDLISIALLRVPAGEPANREGAILVNPGGPGDSGIEVVLDLGPSTDVLLGAEVPARFDLVGFDPRGIGQSTQIRCFDTVDEASAVLPTIPFPLTRAEEREFARSGGALARACRSYPGARRVGEHLSTANVARDMDVIRASMGEESLNFLGLSYGSFVAATYANLFPDRVRAVVADGVVDPVAWVNREGELPLTTAIRSDEGAAETLEEFFAQCEEAATGNCAFAPNSRERYSTLAAALRDAPIELPDPETGGAVTFTYQQLISLSLGFLYDTFSYAEMADGLAYLESIAFGSESLPVAPHVSWLRIAPSDEEPYENIVENGVAVACVDSNNPRSYRTYSRAGAEADAEYGYFGRIFTWTASPCAQWPFRDRDRYQGPFTAVTANPVLVIGNLYDPGSRYEGAQALRSLLPNSGLLTVDVPGHTSLGLSACAGAITGQYFLDPSTATTVDGFTCPAEFNVFDVMASASSGVTASAETNAEPDIATMAEIRASIVDDIGFITPAAVR